MNSGGTVTGIVRGLSEGTGPATSVEILSNTLNFGLGEYIGNALDNTWTVTGGTLTDFAFLSFGSGNSAPAVTDASLIFVSQASSTGVTFRAGLSPSESGVTSNASDVSTADIALTFTPAGTVAPVPLPATGLLLLAGLGGLGLFRRRAA